jgi:malonyl-CoA/methylmalonyl-CoA synthetase
MISIFAQAEKHLEKTAIISDGAQYTYNQLLDASKAFAFELLDGKSDLNEARVAYMVNPGFDYVRVQWGIWRAGGVAVPLCLTYPLPSLRYTIENSGSSIVVVSPEFEDLLKPLCEELGLKLLSTSDSRLVTSDSLPTSDSRLVTSDSLPTSDSRLVTSDSLPVFPDSRRAMMLYTSGTTNLPKGVVSTHANLNAQISALIDAWRWTSADYSICILPLHHIHGVINIVSCSLWAGATCQFLPSFSAEALFDIFKKGQLNVFMAVPTIYYKLITYWESLADMDQKEMTRILSKFRLMISGSAALPVSVMERWKTISEHSLLERYGMTEIGMALSNPYDGPRVPGHVGYPLPGVQVRLADEQDNVIPGTEIGEIQVKGANVFSEYWQKPESTAESFTPDGFFKTGDIATMDELGGYRILGRNSVDIIKSGGYKISALEIEEVLRTYPGIDDCCVVGVEDDEWGELVSAAIVYKEDLDTKALNAWMREQMPAYKTPRAYHRLAELPRNAMGKVTKKDVINLIKN